MDIYFLADLFTDYGVFLVMALGGYVTLMAHQISIGHGAIAGIGAYTTAILTVKLGLPVVLSVPLAAVTGMLTGLLIALVMALRLKRLYLGIGTFAFGEAMVVVWLNFDYVGGALGFIRIPVITDLTLVYSIVAVLTFLLWRFEKSHRGLAFRAVFDDEVTAAAMGVNVSLVKVMAWAIGGSITAVGGALYAHSLSVIRPDNFGFSMSVLILLAPTIGGYRTFWGTFIGAAVIVFAPWVLNVADPLDKRIFYGALYVVMMVWRPEGLIGRQGLRWPRAFPTWWPQR
jgi:branched-chain amino acid transport system permease protein